MNGVRTRLTCQAGMTSIQKAVAHLREMGGERLVHEALEAFTAEVPQRLRELRGALRMGDCITLTRAAHTLRAIAAPMGLAALASFGRKIEQMGRSRKLDGVAPLIAAAESEWIGARSDLQRAARFHLVA